MTPLTSEETRHGVASDGKSVECRQHLNIINEFLSLKVLLTVLAVGIGGLF